MHRYETTLPGVDTRLSQAIYREGVGLALAYRDPKFGIVQGPGSSEITPNG